jgi:endonuclease III
LVLRFLLPLALAILVRSSREAMAPRGLKTARSTIAAKHAAVKAATPANSLPKPKYPASLAERKRQAARVIERLAADYPAAECALAFSNPLELLIATILSAQCTDVRVNMVTPDLFRRYRSAGDFANAKLPELEKAIQSTGFFRNKAKNIQACCRQIVDENGGEVPRELESLVRLPGVGRKTASVVLGTAFGIASGVVVDTHVTRLTQRLGLTKAKDAVKIEHDLMAIVPREEWIDFSHRLIHHGRQICIARKPKCPQCSMLSFCPRVGVTSISGS